MDYRRPFGVEIEHGNIELGYEEVGRLVQKKFPRWDNTGHDGSGIEVRSPILKGQSGLDELGEVMEYLKSIGGFISRSDGMHVHHDARDFVPKNLNVSAQHIPGYYDDRGRYIEGKVKYPSGVRVERAADNVLRVLETYSLNQPLISQLVDPNRRSRSPISKETLDRIKKNKRPVVGRHAVHYTDEHNTFEFRQHEGCLDPYRAFAWIEFGQHFLNYCKHIHRLNRPPTCATSAVALLKRLDVSAATRRALLDRPEVSQIPNVETMRQRMYERRRLLIQAGQGGTTAVTL